MCYYSLLVLVVEDSLANAGVAGDSGSSTCLGPRIWGRALIPALHLSPSSDSLLPLTSPLC